MRPADTAKRAIDVLVSTSALLALLPVFLVVGIVVRLRLGSPVIFRQVRPGKYGVPFELLKFRSMLDGDGSDNERLTSFGAKLRSTSLDELPEIWNILRGDMSLVGPRPLLTEYLPLYSERQRRRHEVRPGLTGLAQVSGRNLLSWEERFELDVEYVDTQSFKQDLVILVRTFRAVIGRDGITPEDETTMSKFTGVGSE